MLTPHKTDTLFVQTINIRKRENETRMSTKEKTSHGKQVI